ncbi:MAG: hypothetical protein LUC83_09935 [Clostridiales bacterium]|nr:hypothetical protein [Clostridiales bacterium]
MAKETDCSQEILQLVKQMSEKMDDGFARTNQSIADLEKRLTGQEERTNNLRVIQHVQADEIKELRKIVKDLAESDGIRKVGDGTAIQKEPAYAGFDECGISRRKAMKALRDAEVIRPDSEGRNTCTVRIDGKVTRVIVVCADEGEKA